MSAMVSWADNRIDQYHILSLERALEGRGCYRVPQSCEMRGGPYPAFSKGMMISGAGPTAVATPLPRYIVTPHKFTL